MKKFIWFLAVAVFIGIPFWYQYNKITQLENKVKQVEVMKMAGGAGWRR